MPATDFRFVDTNLLIYAYDRSAGEKHERTKSTLEQLWRDRNGCLSIQVLQEFYVNITHKIMKPLASETAAAIVRDLSTWKVHIPGIDDILKAIDIEQKYHLSFWDAMIIQSALATGSKRILSEDFSAAREYEGLVVQRFL